MDGVAPPLMLNPQQAASQFTPNPQAASGFALAMDMPEVSAHLIGASKHVRAVAGVAVWPETISSACAFGLHTLDTAPIKVQVTTERTQPLMSG